jgi:hypothetical protein
VKGVRGGKYDTCIAACGPDSPSVHTYCIHPSSFPPSLHPFHQLAKPVPVLYLPFPLLLNPTLSHLRPLFLIFHSDSHTIYIHTVYIPNKHIHIHTYIIQTYIHAYTLTSYPSCQRAPSAQMARPAKYQLTLSQLAEFDDLLTDALVDRVSTYIFFHSHLLRLGGNPGLLT